jgi:hypothetical protein
MAKARRHISPRSKPRRRAAALAHPPSASVALSAAVPAAAPLAVMAGEMQSFSKRRLGRLMAASSRMMAARDMGDATVIHSQFLLDAIDDYVSEAGRVAQIWMQAVGANWGLLRSTGEAVGRDLSRGAEHLQSLPARTASDLAMTSAVVH